MPQPMSGGQGKLAGLSSFLKTYRFQGSNFDYQVLWQVQLLTKPSFKPQVFYI